MKYFPPPPRRRRPVEGDRHDAQQASTITVKTVCQGRVSRCYSYRRYKCTSETAREKKTNTRAQMINQSVRVCSVHESGCATALDPSAYAVCRCCLRKMSSGLQNAQPLHRHTPSGAGGPHGLAHRYQRLPVSACHSGKSLEQWLSVPWSQSSPRRLRQPPFPLVAVWG